MTGIKMDSTVVVSKEQMSCGLDDEAVILSLKKGVYYSLNPCGNRIWSLLQKPMRNGCRVMFLIRLYHYAFPIIIVLPNNIPHYP